jgi:hypothetical protein
MPQVRINVKYYIEKGIIPPLERLFLLLGADPRRQAASHISIPRTMFIPMCIHNVR